MAITKVKAVRKTLRDDTGIEPDTNLMQREKWTPVSGGVSIGVAGTKTGPGIEIRGCKNTSKGKRSRGPMA